MPKALDLTGQRFGRLTVTGKAPKRYSSNGKPIVMWFCDCDCGKKGISISCAGLRHGGTSSCGCWRTEKSHLSKFKQQTTYDLSGDFGIGYTAKGDEFWFDKEDYELISKFNWHKHHNYFEAWVPMSKPRRSINIHRLVMGVADIKYDFTMDVDHICTEHKFDNRKCNLRIVNKSQNNINKVVQKNNKSGVPGVKKASKSNNWEVYININKKHTYLGTYVDFNDAVAARKAAEEKYYKEYSYDNSQRIAQKYL